LADKALAEKISTALLLLLFTRKSDQSPDLLR